MKNTPLSSQPTITEVQLRFESWRKTRKPHQRIPEDLWLPAVMLCEKFSIHQISKALRLNHSALQDRVHNRQTIQPVSSTPLGDFIPLDIVQPSVVAEWHIELEHRNGNRMKMHAKGQVDLDLQAIAASFWI